MDVPKVLQGGTELEALLTFCPCGPGSPGAPASPVSPCPEGKYQHQMQWLLSSPIPGGVKSRALTSPPSSGWDFGAG